ncbi:acetylornithine deacetylase [Castellaniella sp.]|uniref:acetylornithine deacetylase n=1 Tax=Castellaniella sp. TaxID=1955812 RepID=UPI00355E5D70
MARKIPALREMIAQLVATLSVSSSTPGLDVGNAEVNALLAGWCESLGFRTRLLPVPGKPGHVNLIATLGRGTDGLVLAGHTDTVPFDPHLWQSDPLALTEHEGRLTGLGIADMKAFFAFVLDAVESIDPARLGAPLTLIATADEEAGMTGARALTSLREYGRHVVIGEPTGGVPVRMHKGNMMHRLILIGQSGHSSDPSLGRNALDGMHAVMTDLMAFRQSLQNQYRHAGFSVPVPTLNLGCIHGGDNPNRICGHCELSFDFRLLPGMNGVEIRERIRERAVQVAHAHGLEARLDVIMDVVPGMETPADAAIVLAAERISAQPAQAVSFTTEGPFYRAQGMDVVIMGPGDIACAHQPGEHLSVARINQTTRHLQALIGDFCLS